MNVIHFRGGYSLDNSRGDIGTRTNDVAENICPVRSFTCATAGLSTFPSDKTSPLRSAQNGYKDISTGRLRSTHSKGAARALAARTATMTETEKRIVTLQKVKR